MGDADGGRITAYEHDVSRVDAAGRTLWTHTAAGRPREAYVSGDRVLVTTDSVEYTEWGTLGPALLLDLGDGALVAELRGEKGAALDGGRFVIGLEGYDVFDTWLHDRDGTLLTTWRSHGHHFPDPDGGVRVVECDRSTGSRVVRLLPGGAIERGPHLTDGSVPRPVVLGDGTIVLLDAGVLRAVDRGLKDTTLARLLPIPRREAYRFAGELLLEDGGQGGRLTVAIAELPPDDPAGTRTRSWTFALSRRSGRLR